VQDKNLLVLGKAALLPHPYRQKLGLDSSSFWYPVNLGAVAFGDRRLTGPAGAFVGGPLFSRASLFDSFPLDQGAQYHQAMAH
jgi:hypothetical protein